MRNGPRDEPSANACPRKRSRSRWRHSGRGTGGRIGLCLPSQHTLVATLFRLSTFGGGWRRRIFGSVYLLPHTHYRVYRLVPCVATASIQHRCRVLGIHWLRDWVHVLEDIAPVRPVPHLSLSTALRAPRFAGGHTSAFPGQLPFLVRLRLVAHDPCSRWPCRSPRASLLFGAAPGTADSVRAHTSAVVCARTIEFRHRGLLCCAV